MAGEATTIARPYAEAVFNRAVESGDLDNWSDMLSLLAAVTTDPAMSGLIGFVGLIVPHVLRLVLGADHRVLVPASALAGAGFLLAADTLARTALAPTELPVGAFTSLIGGPLFLVLLRRELLRSGSDA